MKYIISTLLRYPLYYFLFQGIIKITGLTGLSVFWSIPICVLIVYCFHHGEKIERKGFK